MSWSKRFAGVFAFMLVLLGGSANAFAIPSKIFKSCIDLNNQFYYGVAKDQVSTVSMGNDLLHVSLSIYNANKNLDIDNDGVVCEVESLQNSTRNQAGLTKNSKAVINVLVGGIFRNCSQFNRTYKFGVALNSVATGEYPAKISRVIYLKFSNLDFDNDGIVCEKETLQNATVKKTVPVATVPVATVPVATVPVATVPIATVPVATIPKVIATTTTLTPLPTSPQRVNWNTGGTLNLRTGVTYIIQSCLNNSGTISYLEVLTSATAWTTKVVGFKYIDATKCTDPKYPYLLEWTWQVTETAGQASKMRITPWGSEMNIVIS